MPRPCRPLGGPQAIRAMITEALHPASAPSPHVDAEWVVTTAEKVLAAVEAHRSSWQSWHVRAEAQRHVPGCRRCDRQRSISWLSWSSSVLQTGSISLARPDDPIYR